MHEYSVVQALLNQCEDVAEQNNANMVTKVITKIGVMSGIETHLLQTAFDTFKEGTICDGAEFIINEQKVKLHCNSCRTEFEIDEVRYACTECESLDVKVIDGEDMYLMSLEME
ncbi:hydrogenase maturation nickel metallochaperone HypA [Sulfurovum sp. XTW-4]|uniref:Hydrogenase maturation factor HypA n=1 Tax=Sulfurovum xiamenensis TaxID=3019066 RepID=A0ABT7QSI7_9BACT|nr:hydrogenase maturation nickel metallochaperone HypA [Sulfurovum xiamenensis]MDM5263975.1 hydrogenase maturation nickel metallochaperone HypA [Sulfurovum xiamenensis]